MAYGAYQAYKKRRYLAAAASAGAAMYLYGKRVKHNSGGFYRGGGHALYAGGSKRKVLKPASPAARKLANSTGNWNVVPKKNVVIRRTTSFRRKVRRSGRSYYGGRRFYGGRRRRQVRKSVRRRNRLYRTKGSLVKDAYYKGCTIRQERGGVMSDPFCLTIGHTVPFRQVRRAFFMSIIKLALDKAGISMESPDQSINLAQAGDQIYIYYRSLDQPASATQSFFNYTIIANDSLTTITTGIVNNYETALVAGLFQDLVLETVMFFANGANDLASVRISLLNAKCSYYFNSVMKLQNRTSDGAANTEVTDLVAQHVVGKSYSGYGNYTPTRIRPSYTSAAYPNIIGDNKGLISAVSTGNPDYQWKEPAPANHFEKVDYSTGVRFAPGELKHSYVRYKCSMPISQFLKEVVRRWDPISVGDEPLTPYRIEKAKFKFFMLEKEIETVDLASPATNVTIGWEIDQTVGCVINPMKSTFLTRENWINAALPSL